MAHRRLIPRSNLRGRMVRVRKQGDLDKATGEFWQIIISIADLRVTQEHYAA
jgi:hypothetical protein